MQHAFIALGANLRSLAGTPAQTLRAALASLTAAEITLVAQSRLYRTPCFPAGAGPDYVNAVACVMTSLAPASLLDILHAIEADYDRQRDSRWGMRTLDLDLLAMGDLILPDTATLRHWMELAPDQQATQTPAHLILPHPRLQDRAFVLVPLAEIAPEWTHPALGLTARALRDALAPADLVAVVALD